MPRDLLGKLLRQVKALQRDALIPNGLNASGLHPREVSVLRLVADCWSTDKIAEELRYSERTVKNVIYSRRPGADRRVTCQVSATAKPGS